MDPFWETVQKILKGLASKEAEGMMELEWESDKSQPDSRDYTMTFHTNEDKMMVVSVFDPDQWSLLKDMSSFLNKPVEDIVRELDPSGPNIYVVDPKEI
jgi:hypothetical protein